LNIEHNEKHYEIYAFGNMFTFPPYRKQGYGKQILKLASDFILKSDVDAGILFCNTNVEAFYKSFDWVTTRVPVRRGTVDDYEEHEGIKTMILPVTRKGKQGRVDFDSHPLYVRWLW
jgi:hypothetical protein